MSKNSHTLGMKHSVTKCTNQRPSLLSNLHNPITHNPIKDRVSVVYGDGEGNWGDLPIFFDGFINFGYWKNIPTSTPLFTPRNRRDSSADLYKYTLDMLSISITDRIVELGCGRGVGMIDSFTCNGKQTLVGIDITEAQINKANTYAKQAPTDTSCMKFIAADATELPLANGSVDKIYSVEVLQHIDNFSNLAKEIKRVLTPEGKFAFVAHLSQNHNAQQTLAEQKLLINDIEILENIDSIKSTFKENNLATDCHSIGSEVFHGYQKWVLQVNPGDRETAKIFTAYQGGLIDYFACLVSFE